jgi:hypothetical protein
MEAKVEKKEFSSTYFNILPESKKNKKPPKRVDFLFAPQGKACFKLYTKN